MAIATQTCFTPEDLLAITDRPMPKLVAGKLVERPPTGQKSDAIAARLLRDIGNYVEDADLGLVNGSRGSYQIFPDDPQKVRIPDASFTPKDRLSATGAAEGHSRVVPALVVEVVSPNDSASDLNEKIEDFLAAGVPLIWVPYPETRSVYVYRGDGTGTLLRAGDALEGEAILPGFRCEAAKLFEGIA